MAVQVNIIHPTVVPPIFAGQARFEFPTLVFFIYGICPFHEHVLTLEAFPCGS